VVPQERWSNVRVTPVVGDKVWFAPRRFGWGLSPISTEGWVVMGAMVLISLVIRRRRDLPRWVPPALMLPFLLVVLLKGTSPGGPRARSFFEAARDADEE
jgi:hypothetical protein